MQQVRSLLHSYKDTDLHFEQHKVEQAAYFHCRTNQLLDDDFVFINDIKWIFNMETRRGKQGNSLLAMGLPEADFPC